MARRSPTVIKFGGELLEDPRRLRRIAKMLVEAAASMPIVVVHGGGRAVDREMASLGLPKRAVDGLRVTNAATLDVVLGVLAGRVNTRVVAAIGAAGGSAVGLTGADAGIARVRKAKRYHASDGSRVDLGFVGVPEGTERPTLVDDLTRRGHIPVVASIGSDAKGRLYNVNADTLAGDLAPRIGARRLIVAGATAGVLDASGHTIPVVDDTGLIKLIRERQASAGMVTKLLACRDAHASGVRDVTIVDGRRASFLGSGRAPSTTIVTSDRNGTRTPRRQPKS